MFSGDKCSLLKIRYVDELVERQVPGASEIVPKYVDVPVIKHNVIKKPVEHVVETIVEVPKVGMLLTANNLSLSLLEQNCNSK